MRQIPLQKDGTKAILADDWNSVKNEWQNILPAAGLNFDSSNEHQLTAAVKKLLGFGLNTVLFKNVTGEITPTDSSAKFIFQNTNLPSFTNKFPPKNLVFRFKDYWSYQGSDDDLKMSLNDSNALLVVSPFYREADGTNPYFPNSPYLTNNTNGPPYNLMYDEVPFFTYSTVQNPTDINIFAKSMKFNFPKIWWEGKVINKIIDGKVDPNQFVISLYPLESLWNHKVPFFMEGLDDKSDLGSNDPNAFALVSIPEYFAKLFFSRYVNITSQYKYGDWQFANYLIVYVPENTTFPRLISNDSKIYFQPYTPGSKRAMRSDFAISYYCESQSGQVLETTGYHALRYIPGYCKYGENGYFIISHLLSSNI